MPDTISIRSDDVAWQEVEGEVVVLDLRTSRYLSLNSSAAALWSAIAEAARSPADLARVLVDRFELPEDQAALDAESFVTQCVDLGLIS